MEKKHTKLLSTADGSDGREREEGKLNFSPLSAMVVLAVVRNYRKIYSTFSQQVTIVVIAVTRQLI